jgi:hypothetical protein
MTVSTETIALEAEAEPHVSTSVPVVEDGDGDEKRDRGLGRLPELAVGMALATLLIAVAFAGARSSKSWATDLFWTGQVILYALPAAFLLFRRSIGRAEAFGIALLMPIATFLILAYYSPDQFRFIDEFQHVQTAQTILNTHHLFHLNTSLPVSSQFPGLEIITTALVAITHLSITTSGMIVTGLAHVLVGVCLYFLVVELSGRPRVAAFAAVIYATGPHYQFFDSYFIYQTIAIPFFLLSLLAVVKMLKAKGGTANAWGVVAVACGAVTVVSHHVTSYVLVAVLLAFSVAQLFLPRETRTWRVPALFGVIAAMVIGWDLGIATATWAYIKPILDSLFGQKGILPNSQKKGVAGSLPRIDTIWEYLSTLLLVVLTPFGAWQAWKARRGKSNAVTLGLGVGALSIFVVLVVRVASGDGGELAGRAMSFALIPVSLVVAAIVVGRVRKKRDRPKHGLRRYQNYGLAAVGTAFLVVLAVGGIAGGLPSYYARLPGPYRVSAYERSVDAHNIDASVWAAANLPHGGGIASDDFTASMFSSLGYQAYQRNISALFLSSSYTTADRSIVTEKRITYVVGDKRITEQLPAAGYYFSPDPHQGNYKKPLPSQTIDKYNDIPGVSRVFDDGTIVIYDLAGAPK